MQGVVVQGLGGRVLGFGVSGLGFWVQGFGFRLLVGLDFFWYRAEALRVRALEKGSLYGDRSL